MDATRSRRLPVAVEALLDAAANPDLRRLELASLAWATAEATYLVGLLVVAYELGGPAAVAVLAVVRALPSVALAPILTNAADRLATDVQLRGVLVIRVASVVALTALFAAGASTLVLLILAGVDAVAATLLRPIRGSLIPALARTPGELVAANVATTTGESAAALAGPALAAVLLVAAGPLVCLSVGAALLVPAALAAAGISASQHGHVAAHGPAGSGRPSLLAGLGRVLRLRHARIVVALFVCQRLVRGMLTVLVVAAAIELLDLGDAGVGILSSAVGAGGLLGGIVAVGLVGRSRLAPAFVAGLAAWGAGVLVPGILPVPALALTAFAVAGLGKVVLDVAGFSLLQRTVPVQLRAQTFGVLEGCVTAALAVGSVLASVLVAVLGAGGALVAAGLLPLAAAGVGWLALRNADAAAVVPERELAILRHVPAFRPLGLNSLELLARAVEWRVVPAGRSIVRQGEYGDRFYVAESGRFEVLVDDEVIGDLGPGSSFGEIALIRARPRTATVRATRDAVLAAIDGEAFLAAVNGHADSAAAVEAQVAERLSAAGA